MSSFFEIYGEYFNKNYEVTFEKAVLSIEISIYDTFLVGAVFFVLLCIFTVISAGKKNKKKTTKKKKKGGSSQKKPQSSSKSSSSSNTPKTYV